MNIALKTHSYINRDKIDEMKEKKLRRDILQCSDIIINHGSRNRSSIIKYTITGNNAHYISEKTNNKKPCKTSKPFKCKQAVSCLLPFVSKMQRKYCPSGEKT